MSTHLKQAFTNAWLLYVARPVQKRKVDAEGGRVTDGMVSLRCNHLDANAGRVIVGHAAPSTYRQRSDERSSSHAVRVMVYVSKTCRLLSMYYVSLYWTGELSPSLGRVSRISTCKV